MVVQLDKWCFLRSASFPPLRQKLVRAMRPSELCGLGHYDKKRNEAQADVGDSMSGITYANIRQTPKEATSCAVMIVREKNGVPTRQVVTCGMSLKSRWVYDRAWCDATRTTGGRM